MNTTVAKFDKIVRRTLIIRKLILISIILFALIVLVANLLPPRMAIDYIGFRAFLISDTESMEPILTHKDLILVTRTNFEDLEVGDIVAFRSMITRNGVSRLEVIAHQVAYPVFYEDGTLRGYRTRGSNPRVGYDRAIMTYDGVGNTSQFIGVVRHYNTQIGMFFHFTASEFGRLVLIVNSLGLIACWILMKSDNDDDEELPQLLNKYS